MQQRRQLILERVNRLGRQSLNDLAEHFAVSVQTLRSDIRLLTEQGLLIRNHGEVQPFPHRENVGYDHRQIRNTAGKAKIARRCAAELSDYQSLFLGTGSTVAQLAQALSGLKGLQVMTNNLHAVRQLCDHPDCQLTIAGGQVRQRDQDVIGGDAIRFFGRYRADVGIVSVGAISRHGELFDFNDDEVMAREALLSQCRLRILLIDSSKFNSEACCNAGRPEDFDWVISDTPLELQLRNRLLAQGVRLLDCL